MSLIAKILGRFLGNKHEKDVKLILPLVQQINEEYARLNTLSNDEIREKSSQLIASIRGSVADIEKDIEQHKQAAEDENTPLHEREKIFSLIEKLEKELKEILKKKLDESLPLAFAIMKDTARRFKENQQIVVRANDKDREFAATKDFVTIEGNHAVYSNSWKAGGNTIVWDMVHYDVQLIGGVVLHQGKISEMSTGEGKTLVATLPVFLNALAGRGVHIITVNDYLARRDSEWMGPLYQFHGLTVECIDKYQPHSAERRKAYFSDITFGTNNEFGFDYLRDNMTFRPEELVQREHYYAIVDEVDSVLIDDARTPLIISGPVPKGDDQLFYEMKPKVNKLITAQKTLITDLLIEVKRLINEGKTEEGGKLLLRAHKGMPKNKAIIKFLSEQGMKSLMMKTENFYMQNNNKDMHIITDPLYFVIDEKHNSVELTEKGIDLITDASDDSNFFVLPDIGSVIADIEKSLLTPAEKVEKKDALLTDYAIKSERVHTINQLLKAYAMFEKDIEYVVMDNKVKIVDEQTGRILEGRRYSDGLHQAIEAKENVKVEAATQTMATITLQNYFRMYHKLAGMTGTAETEAGELWNIYKLDVVVIPTNKSCVRQDREDMVFKTKREKYSAVIEEIVQLTQQGRPVLVGTTSVEVSELLSRMLKLRGIKHNVLNAKQHQREAEIVSEAGKASIVTIATNMAGRGTDIKLSQEVRAAGGLAIIGTERHESRRVDRQLRGRAGRQGDPGSSQFYVSLEDDLMRLFGSDRISRMMDRLGLKEGEVIQHPWITKSIERAQRKVEENNFGIRKRLLEYDDVMNSQREVIYKLRRQALFGERLDMNISNMIFDVAENVVSTTHQGADPEEFKLELIRAFSIDSPISDKEFLQMPAEEITEKVNTTVLETFQRKSERIQQTAWPVIKQVYETQAANYENIVVPFADGVRMYNILTNLAKAYETQAREVNKAFRKTILLATIDEEWKENLRELDELKNAVQNASYEQKDPLLIYKFESFGIFAKMMNKLNREVVGILLKSYIPMQQADTIHEAPSSIQRNDTNRYQTNRNGEDPSTPNRRPQPVQPVRTEKLVGRNDPCPCGSGKKYKHCHGVSLNV